MSVFDDLVRNAEKLTSQSRITTPTHKGSSVASPPISGTSAPIPFSVKADITPKGEVTSWLSLYRDPTTGEVYKDSYLDVTEVGFMTSSVKELEQKRKRTNDPYLLPYLNQHQRTEVIGGIKAISENAQGYAYTAQINLKVQKGREAFSLIEEKMLSGSSYGYDALRYWYEEQPQKGMFDEQGDRIRHLLEVKLHEISICTFPAHEYARVIGAKARGERKSIENKIAGLADKMGASFDALEKQLNSMHSAWPEMDWLENPYRSDSEVGEDITLLLHEIQQRVRRS